MKRAFFTTWAFLACLCSMAQTPNENLAARHHLQLVNAEWLKHAELAPVETISFDTDAERIQLHLNLVVEHLRSKSTALTSEKLYQRERLLDTLQHYAQKGVFPINLYHKGRRPYFIDYRNTHCAVGYLIKASGHGDLAQKISQEHNYDYIADIETEGLTEWAQQHGFAWDELAWIQPAYPKAKRSISLDGGVNGEVTCLKWREIEYGKGTVVTGDFDTVGTTPCRGVAFYSARTGTWYCLGEGVKGKTEQIGSFDGQLALYGSFDYQGTNYPVAVYRQKTGWEYPERKFDTKHIATAGGHGFISYYFPEENRSELWTKGFDSNMVNVLDIKGRVNAIVNYERTYFENTVLLGGAFDSIKRPKNDKWLPSYNLCYTSYNRYPYSMSPVSKHVMDTIFTMQSQGRTVYIGGHCRDSVTDHRKNCLVQLIDTTFLPVLQFEHLNNGNRKDSFSQIRDIIFNGLPSSRILLAGDFRVSDGGMFHSYGIGEYSPISGVVSPYLNIGGHVNALGYFRGRYLVFGGSFTSSYGYNRAPIVLNNLGRTYDEVGIDDRQVSSLALYPNPASDELSIQLKNEDRIERIQIKTINGQVLQETQGQGSSSLQIQLPNLSSGLYLAEVTTHEGQVWVQKLMVR